MPIIGSVGRKSISMRVLNISIHAVLFIGAITMIYPFLLMISSSFRSHIDINEFSIVPHFFYNDQALFQKYVESHLNEESNRLTDQLNNRFLTFENVIVPDNVSEQFIKDWEAYLNETGESQSIYDFYVSEQYGRGIYSSTQRQFRNLMKEKYNSDLTKLNHHFGTYFVTWDEVLIEEKDISSKNFSSNDKGIMGEYNRFKLSLPWYKREYVNLDGCFISQELIPLFQNNLQSLNDSLGTHFNSWDDIRLEQTIPQDALREYWLHFVRKLLNIHFIGLLPDELPHYQEYLKQKYGSIELLNQTYHSQYLSFSSITLPDQYPHSGAIVEDFSIFIEGYARAESIYIKSVDLSFKQWLKNKYQNIDQYSRVYKPGFTDFSQISLPELCPEDNLNMKADWIRFIKGQVDYKQIILNITVQSEYLLFLQEKFPDQKGSIDLKKVNQLFGKDWAQEIDIYPSERLPLNGSEKEIWIDFVKNKVDGKYLSIDSQSSQSNWQSFLKNNYKNIKQLNQSYGLLPLAFNQIKVSHLDIIYHNFLTHKKEIRKEFLTRNYINVLDLILYNGKALKNTLIYCLMSILIALIVNPLAAYALSRFKPAFTYQLLMIFMLTMAFPAMVMGIPNFIILKKLNLLNTFWALVLPAAADGYFIFLLKGFFDSLPKEIIESATLDGVSETRLFWQFIMSLSKPILAVIALGAFNAAYRNFMFAFIVCQNQDMWTLMVHIYNLIQRSASGVGYASLVIAAIPTLVVFIFFQNIIIKAIVVPTEK